MKLLEVWLDYVSSAGSPDSYKESTYYGLISSALQRRVWLHKGIDVLYPNIFTILVGTASTGKGQLIRPAKDLLGSVYMNSNIFSTESPEENTTLTKSMTNLCAFPMPPDSTTLRGLTSSIAKSIMVYNQQGYKEKTKRSDLENIVNATPCCYWLDELSSLIKTQTETKELTRFLTNVWDNRTFKHVTHTNGEDHIHNPCLTLIAGCTPDFLKDAMTGRYLQEGFNSRTTYVYGEKKETREWIRTGLSGNQIKSLETLRRRLLKLSRLYGEVRLTPDANDWCADWYVNKFTSDRKNHNAFVTDWYNRKDMHLLKHAIIQHFGDKDNFEIDLDDVLVAKDYLDRMEVQMHQVFRMVGNNKTNDIRIRLLESLKAKPKPEIALGIEFIGDISTKELGLLLKEMRTLKQIELKNGIYYASDRDNG